MKLDWQCSQDTHEPDLLNKEQCRSRNYNHDRGYILQLSLSIWQRDGEVYGIVLP